MTMDLDRILPRVVRPARYTGGEWNSVLKSWDDAELRVALAFPDLYEVGANHPAVAEVYDLINREPPMLCERVFAPWPDMQERMRQASLPLFSIESQHPLGDFDLVLFYLEHELCYVTVLTMLDLAGVPLQRRGRSEGSPLLVGLGPCAYNPEPLATFLDGFALGDPEAVLPPLFSALSQAGPAKGPALLKELLRLPGMYLPGFYRTAQDAEAAGCRVVPAIPQAPPVIRPVFLQNAPPPVVHPIVPNIEVVHDGGFLELARAHPFKPSLLWARPAEEAAEAVEELLHAGGYDRMELLLPPVRNDGYLEQVTKSLSSRLSTFGISLLVRDPWVSPVEVRLAGSLAGARQAPLRMNLGAGSEPRRRALGLAFSNSEVVEAAEAAFAQGWSTIRLHWHIGLPQETPDQLDEAIALVGQVQDAGARVLGRRPHLRVAVTPFVPKPHTPWQREAMDTSEGLQDKAQRLRKGLKRLVERFSWQDPYPYLLQGAIGRGDARMGEMLLVAKKLGCLYSAAGEGFDALLWQRALEERGVSLEATAQRQLGLEELLPWSHIQVEA